MLDKLDVGKVSEEPEVWEKVVRKLRTGAMPPAGLPRPDKATNDSLAAYLETALDSAAAANPNPGRPAVHRLNRAEYTNAIRDLLALDIDGGSLLPADDSGYGFDNIGDVLSVSPMLVERYVSVARQISRLAVGDPTIRPAVKTYDGPKFSLQDDRASEALPFWSRGGMAIQHNFPLDGQYLLRISPAKERSQSVSSACRTARTGRKAGWRKNEAVHDWRQERYAGGVHAREGGSWLGSALPGKGRYASGRGRFSG